MQITKKNLSPTKLELNLTADEALLSRLKTQVVATLSKDVNMAGFRKGHAPKGLVEKSLDQNLLQSSFLDTAVNEMYVAAISEEHIRPVAQPEVNIKKYVPFTTLELTVIVEAVGAIKLADYKKIKLAKKTETATDVEVDTVLEDLRARDSQKLEVKRAAKASDEVTINFHGSDAKTKADVDGASGNDYALILGSDTFIPGFEPELIGLKAGDEKTFTVTFPKDYGTKALQSKKVSFSVKVTNIKEVTLPELDATFAAKVGPFGSVVELKTDVKKQLQTEKDTQAQREFENELLASLAEKSQAAVPKVLVDEEMARMEEEEKRNLVYRGQTWQEHLDSEGKTAEEHREGQREQAEARVKTGLVLAEAADAEGITVSPDELDQRIELLKKQYSDTQMQAELNNPENRREIRSRILTEKAIARLVEYATKK